MYDVISEWKLTLADLGDPELFVVFQDPQDFEVADYRRIQDANNIIVRLQRGALMEDSDLWALNALDALMAKSLLRWNLYDRKTRELLPTDVTDPFERVPMTVFRFIIDEFRTRLLEIPKSGHSRDVQLREPRVPRAMSA